MTEHRNTTTHQDSEFTDAFGRVIEQLKWFWTNPIVRKYLLVSKLPRDRVRTISEFLDDDERLGDARGITPHRVDPLIRAVLDLADSVENEVKPMLDLELQRAGPGRGGNAKTQLKLTRSTLETNAQALLRELEALRVAALKRRN